MANFETSLNNQRALAEQLFTQTMQHGLGGDSAFEELERLETQRRTGVADQGKQVGGIGF